MVAECQLIKEGKNKLGMIFLKLFFKICFDDFTIISMSFVKASYLFVCLCLCFTSQPTIFQSCRDAFLSSWIEPVLSRV